MDDSTIEYLEGLINKKMMQYKDLHHCLVQEKISLLDMNTDRLWTISREKEKICREIDTIRSEVFAVSAGSVNHGMTRLSQVLAYLPKNTRARFRESILALKRLKVEIETMRKENMNYINDSLQFLDEMIAIITGETQAKTCYTDKCRLKKSNHYLMLNREV